MHNKNPMLEMVLTSIVNNENIINLIADDIKNRFKKDVDIQKLNNFLSTVELEYKNEPVLV